MKAIFWHAHVTISLRALLSLSVVSRRRKEDRYLYLTVKVFKEGSLVFGMFLESLRKSRVVVSLGRVD